MTRELIGIQREQLADLDGLLEYRYFSQMKKIPAAFLLAGTVDFLDDAMLKKRKGLIFFRNKRSEIVAAETGAYFGFVFFINVGSSEAARISFNIDIFFGISFHQIP